jgi:hypothetical protein
VCVCVLCVPFFFFFSFLLISWFSYIYISPTAYLEEGTCKTAIKKNPISRKALSLIQVPEGPSFCFLAIWLACLSHGSRSGLGAPECLFFFLSAALRPPRDIINSESFFFLILIFVYFIFIFYMSTTRYRTYGYLLSNLTRWNTGRHGILPKMEVMCKGGALHWFPWSYIYTYRGPDCSLRLG